MRLALLTLEGLAAARAVRRFVASNPGRIALVGLSDPFRPEVGGQMGQTARRLKQSGPLILPYLALNFAVPRSAGWLRRRGGDADVEATPLAATCARLGIPCVDVRDVNGAEFQARLAASGAELIVSFHFDQILSEATIRTPPRGGINVHAGLLPQHRGPVPTIHALLDDPVAFGVSIHRLVPRIDAGELLAQAPMADEPGLTALRAALRLHLAALPLLEQVLAEIAAGRESGRPLPNLPYRGFPTPDEMRRLSASGRKATDWADLQAALATPM